MASSTFVNVDLSKFENKIKKLNEAMQVGAQRGMNSATLAAENRAKNIVEITGTKGSAARYRGEYANYGPGNSPGRNNTGLMKDSITREVNFSPTKVTGKFGWLKVYKEYFGFQESGFKNRMAYSAKSKRFIVRRGGQYSMVRGMHAMRDAGKLMKDMAPAFLATNIKNELRKVK